MVVKRAELAKQKLEPREIGSLEEVIGAVKYYCNFDTKEVRIYKETELEDGINPDIYYLFTRD